MKICQTLLPVAVAMILAGCGNRGTAMSVVGQANSAISAAKEEAAFIAPEELKAAEATLAHMQQSFEKRDYKVVVADVPQFNAQMDALKKVMAEKRTVVAAAGEEWSTLNENVPKSVEAIQARVDSIMPDALPKDVTPEVLESAKTELETLKTIWAEASAIASAGNTIEATEKGRIAMAKAAELKNHLGMSETLASAG
ncbi:MAG TPA: hypothetical protein VFU13_09760 [Steroidobacteraceae bacterium]|nr:hypothetical protein [Steroidobacteraceae bacterium]